MTTYSELQTRVSSNVIDLPTAVSSQVATLVKNAHRWCMREHNFWVMRATMTTGTTVSTRDLTDTLPSNWKEARGNPWYTEEAGDRHAIFWAGSRDELAKVYGTDSDIDIGAPRYLLADEFSGDGDALTEVAIECWPFPDGLSTNSDGEYDITIPYWKYLSALTNGSQADWLTTNADEAIEFKATSDAFFKDWDEERGTLWLQRATAAFREARKLDKRLMLSQMGGTMHFHHTGAEAPGLR